MEPAAGPAESRLVAAGQKHTPGSRQRIMACQAGRSILPWAAPPNQRAKRI
ncbi:hypothetical protein pthi1_p16 [Paracoccus phage vB_PthS_Pthi1]|nr:hypothetical protein pthi1_p16 [Paracoccus phage vB_PthS_Pthi1]